MSKRNAIIIGAAGRDFHNFNTHLRGNEDYNVVAFTAAQIPDIAGRKYPVELAGDLYPEGIPIYPEEDLSKLIKEKDVDVCIFSYSDVPYSKVMEISAIVNAAGANFMLLGTKDTCVKKLKACNFGNRHPDRLWKKPDFPQSNRDSNVAGIKSCGCPSSYALW